MDYEVVIVGGGPVGMLLAAELALAEVRVCVLERLKETTPYSRALTLHPRSLELLDMRGWKADLMNLGQPVHTGHFAALETRLDFSALDSASNFSLFIPQHATERVLEEKARELGADIRRGVEVVSVQQHEQGMEIGAVSAEGPFSLSAAYAVGADGAGSLVRKQAGIAFEGTGDTLTAMLGDVVLAERSGPGVLSRYTEQGLAMIVPLPDGMHRVVVIDPERTGVPKGEPVTLEELRAALIRILGSDLGMCRPYWLSRFGNAARQAAQYRSRRLFLAGDAAHIHFPAGGQGLNVGLQEAMNLGWKLAAELQGRAPAWLLDSYHEERFPVNTELLRNTGVQTMLMGSEFSPRMQELRSMLSSLLQIPEANAQLAGGISAFHIRYAPDPAAMPHALNGRRFTELKLRLEDGTLRMAYELFHPGRFVLLHLAADERLERFAQGWRDRHLRVVRASAAAAAPDWDGVHTALIRPDGYIAWAVCRSAPEPWEAVRQGLARWCGEPVTV
ncbi:MULTISPECIES: monooxygenase [Paenibacillus]|uniref:monooxygenase n=1 Tax=Paenibacillus TaxID=44249 RepID=UPI0022B8B410|nr:monooxygenase [Paenibacillus caseinilyticus]MCZ8520288.1 monooxygenase [Paenibacillus caseinilyticus]